MSTVGKQNSDSSINSIDEHTKEGFVIHVAGFENMSIPKKVAVKVEFNGKLLGISHVIYLEKSSEIEVNWELFYEIVNFTEDILNELTSHPLVFTVLNEEAEPLIIVDTKRKKDENIKSKGTSKKGSKRSSSSTLTNKIVSAVASLSGLPGRESRDDKKDIESFVILGITNLDIVPLLRGKDKINELLLIHPPWDLKGSETIAWTNLPRMQVSVEATRSVIKQFTANIENILHFTLCSLLNITPDFYGNVEVATIMPHNQEFEVVKFKNGVLAMDTEVQIPIRKLWQGLSNLQGQSSLSNYKVHDELFDMMNSMEYEVETAVLKSVPRVQWYQIHRCCFSSKSHQVLKNKITKYRCWPIEIFVTEKEKNDKSEKKPLKPTSAENKYSKSKIESGKEKGHYLAFIDLTRLLYPGVTSVQVATQLYTYEDEAIEQKFGSEHYMFKKKLGSDTKTSEKSSTISPKKEQTSQKSSKKGKTSKVLEAEEITKEPSPLPEPEPVFNSTGEPVFIIVQIELIKPFVEKRTINEVSGSIYTIVPQRTDITKEALAAVNSSKAYENCITNLMQVLHDEFQLFSTRNLSASVEKSSRNFLRHLHVTGAFSKMNEALKTAMEDYIIDVLGVPSKSIEQAMLSDIYRHLVLEMCKIIKSVMTLEIDEFDPFISGKDLLYFSVEAFEEGSFSKAKEYLLLRIEKSKMTDPDPWVDLAKLWLKKNEFEKAAECAREAIALDTKHIPALFFHSLLSWLTEDLRVAEVFLSAVVAFDPFYLEGWVALYIFHKQTNNTKFSNVELANGKRLVRDCIITPSDPLLSWCGGIAEKNRIFIITATIMISYSFPELAELALSHDLLIYGRSINYLYYLAVCHYLQGRYEDSLKHLEEALTISWEEAHLWALKGHNQYKLEKTDDAKHSFELALNFVEKTEETHLINLRLGNIFLKEGNYEEARKNFLDICKCSPTPLSWLGLGITNYMDDKLKEAEIALNEANMLDCKMAKIWGYLALVNLMMTKTTVYSQCVSQAVRYGLDDPLLIDRLNEMGEFAETIT